MRKVIWRNTGWSLYWLLLPLIWLYAAVTRPRARVLLVHGDTVLVVKNWLGAGIWALPGGGIEPNEHPVEAAVRELHEELGIVLPATALSSLGQHMAVEPGGLRSRYHLFVCELTAKPELRLREGEIMDAQWLPLQDLLRAPKGVGNTVKQSVTTWSDK